MCSHHENSIVFQLLASHKIPGRTVVHLFLVGGLSIRKSERYVHMYSFETYRSYVDTFIMKNAVR
jgi:hypothetical protein